MHECQYGNALLAELVRKGSFSSFSYEKKIICVIKMEFPYMLQYNFSIIIMGYETHSFLVDNFEIKKEKYQQS